MRCRSAPCGLFLLACLAAPATAQETVLPPATTDEGGFPGAVTDGAGLSPDTPAAAVPVPEVIAVTPIPVETVTADIAETLFPTTTGAGDDPDPLAGPRTAWRQAVATGDTALGFGDWVAELLGDESNPDGETSQAGRTREVSERWLNRSGPVALGRSGRVITTFGAAIPVAYCAPLTICYIELEPGEVLTDTPSWGDTARWQVAVKVQGSDPETLVLEVKPSDDAEITNLVIPTDRRLYTINLVNDPEIHTPILTFLYPDSEARATAARIEARKATEEAAAIAAQEVAAATHAAKTAHSGIETSAGKTPAEDLDFGFRIEGDAPFRPVRVYTDGKRTYIDLHPRYRGALPAVLPGEDEENKTLNTRVAANGERLIADRVIADILLQAGRARVRIRRDAR